MNNYLEDIKNISISYEFIETMDEIRENSKEVLSYCRNMYIRYPTEGISDFYLKPVETLEEVVEEYAEAINEIYKRHRLDSFVELKKVESLVRDSDKVKFKTSYGIMVLIENSIVPTMFNVTLINPKIRLEYLSKNYILNKIKEIKREFDILVSYIIKSNKIEGTV